MADYADTLASIMDALQRRRDRRGPGEPPRPIPAMAIARRFDVRPNGSRDSKRRGVRKLIAELRADGLPVLSSDRGYYLGVTTEDFDQAEAFARKSGLSHLALAANVKRSTARADAEGQYSLGF